MPKLCCLFGLSQSEVVTLQSSCFLPPLSLYFLLFCSNLSFATSVVCDESSWELCVQSSMELERKRRKKRGGRPQTQSLVS